MSRSSLLKHAAKRSKDHSFLLTSELIRSACPEIEVEAKFLINFVIHNVNLGEISNANLRDEFILFLRVPEVVSSTIMGTDCEKEARNASPTSNDYAISFSLKLARTFAPAQNNPFGIVVKDFA